MATSSESAKMGPSTGRPGTYDDDIKNLKDYLVPAFASRFSIQDLPKDKFPNEGMPPRMTAQLIRDLRQLDSTPRLNLASFVTTYAEEECDAVIFEARNVNFIDAEEYPSCQEIHDRCIKMLGDLFHCDTSTPVTGTSCIGSSEAILLGGLALKRRWEAWQERRGIKKGQARPNIVMGTETHVVWEKLVNYFDIEPKWVPNREGHYMAHVDDLIGACDENTIAVVAILGTTYTGLFYDVEALDARLQALNKEKGWQIGIHVDGASGAFIAPFLYPDLKWDFRLPTVISINASGHKFGLVYPGLGWLLWRSREYLPESLIFHDNYLGNDQISITLNFSKPATGVLAQYYQFMRMGREGYTRMMSNMQATMMYLRKGIKEIGCFDLLSTETGVPLVTFTLKDDKRTHGFDEFDIMDRLRQHGWVLPAYTLAKSNQGQRVLRAVCREDFDRTSADMLLADLRSAIKKLQAHFIYTPEQLEQLKESFKQHDVEAHPRQRRSIDNPNQKGWC